MTAAPIRLFIVDDHFLVRQRLVAVLETVPDFQVIGQAESAEEAIQRLEAIRPDVVLMDLNLPGMNGPEAIALLAGIYPDLRLVALTSYETEGDISRAIKAGAHGYLLKTTTRAELVQAVHSVMDGRNYMPGGIRKLFDEGEMWRQLAPKEMGVLAYLAKGLSNREIGEQTGTRETTVKSHVTAILAKLGAADRTEAAALAISERVIDFE